ncbi:hypothetical protein FX016_21725 [Cupriavidus gilardii]|nr:hypothetical protein FX016_21725 [Cupriavidus gilardii]
MRVYNLTSTQYAVDNIERKRLKISTLKDLNDPFELRSYQAEDRAKRIAMTNVRNEFHKRFGLLCFSKAWRNPVLWSHYESHRGSRRLFG